ncbi:hypothetical protein VTN77DRAFT_800 [Rasamsonia byssochlamydoides]|uniref:uncharacterized protein n=1 Tax=Rasamsonia byssochlamydoides TaxID=89139 RepID=UPI003742CE4D
MARDAAKRKADVVDLTLSDREDSPRPSKIGRDDRTNPRLNVSNGLRFGEDAAFIPLSQASQLSRLDEDDAGAIDLVQGSQDFDDAAYNNYELYDDLHTKIVGVRYYRGHATLGEHVILKREPGNPYDSNAIRVDNVMGQQIGHIPRNMAAKLAKYMDSKSLLIEGILTGMIGEFDCPIVLKLYGASDPIKKAELKAQMKSDRLPLGELNRREREQRRLEKEREKQRKEAAKRARAMAKVMGQGQQWKVPDSTMFANLSTPDGMGEGATLEDLINQSSTINPRQMGQAVEKFGINESDLANMPMAEIPPGLATQLLSYQRQGLAWMLEKESPRLPAAGSQDVVQLWKREGNKYRNIATNYSTTQEPPLASGGILADDMGLGKTIQIISLILVNPQPRTPESTKTTLIISPVGVMSNWKNQIEAHVKETNALRVLVYHGAGKKEAANLGQYDVVITSYGALAMEYNPNDKSKKIPTKGLYSIHWRRVVLDEGHTIRNPRSKGALAACNLRADSRWTLTGTPIINSLRDLYSQIRFLRLSGGLEDLAVFNSVLIRPLSCGDPDGASLLREMMAAICLRRRKDMSFVNLKLPPLRSHVLRIKFHPHEQEKYEMFQSEAKGMLIDYTKHGNATYSHILEVILRLRQVCNHWALCKNRVDKLMALLDENKVVDLTPENVKALQEMLQLRIESQETCSICLDTLEQPVITACSHAFDRACIEQVIERQHKCPLCRAEIKDTSTLVSPASELGEDTGGVEVDRDAPSSKIEAMIKILTAQGQAPGTRTVVFSQWTSFLDIVEPHLKRSGIVFTRIDGKMPSVKRDNAITVFSNDPDCKVLLASLNVCSVGLNLVAANQVILADSWWAPAIEDQAMDRVYRLGQTRETTVWRLVMEGSIEDRVLEIQENKRQLSMAALRETGKKKRAEDTAARIVDLEKLLR